MLRSAFLGQATRSRPGGVLDGRAGRAAGDERAECRTGAASSVVRVAGSELWICQSNGDVYHSCPQGKSRWFRKGERRTCPICGDADRYEIAFYRLLLLNCP
jgi:hypothetical protein